jgi:long-chain acyl-CoA synthetase
VRRQRDFLAADWSTVRYLVTAAAPLSVSLTQDFVQAFQRPIIQGYGLSEAVNFSATLPIDLSPEDYERWMIKGRHPSIGVALRGNELQILDESGKPLAADQEGQVHIRGFNVMRAYRGEDPAVTFASGFLPTGDWGYFQESADGQRFFFISGRKKDVIKRYGETLSLREADDLFQPLLQWADDLISVGFDNELGGEELAVLVRGGDSVASREKIEAQIYAKVPRLFHPRIIVFTGQELRTASGKPLRWKLRSWFDDDRKAVFTNRVLFKTKG